MPVAELSIPKDLVVRQIDQVRAKSVDIKLRQLGVERFSTPDGAPINFDGLSEGVNAHVDAGIEFIDETQERFPKLMSSTRFDVAREMYRVHDLGEGRLESGEILVGDIPDPLKKQMTEAELGDLKERERYVFIRIMEEIGLPPIALELYDGFTNWRRPLQYGVEAAFAQTVDKTVTLLTRNTFLFREGNFNADGLPIEEIVNTDYTRKVFAALSVLSHRNGNVVEAYEFAMSVYDRITEDFMGTDFEEEALFAITRAAMREFPRFILRLTSSSTRVPADHDPYHFKRYDGIEPSKNGNGNGLIVTSRMPELHP